MFTLLQDPALYRYENEAPPSLEWLEERFRRLETRRSADGNEQWLNWVVRLRGSSLIGFVQATLRKDRTGAVAYVFGSP
ncbi:MAG TPA: GNAT family N-acetyltransferase, partial [Casimicrobiaceae bacterium]|nr:GNAT family N-acetyltransferase [Casimicrobiaceae bacterium]